MVLFIYKMTRITNTYKQLLWFLRIHDPIAHNNYKPKLIDSNNNYTLLSPLLNVEENKQKAVY